MVKGIKLVALVYVRAVLFDVFAEHANNEEYGGSKNFTGYFRKEMQDSLTSDFHSSLTQIESHLFELPENSKLKMMNHFTNAEFL